MAFVGGGRIAGDDEEPAYTRQGGDDLLDHAVGEIFLLRVAAHIGEGQNRDRRLVGERRAGTRPNGCRAGSRHHTVCPNGPRDVLERLLADIGELSRDLAAHLAKGVFGDADAARFSQAFEARGDVDTVAIDVVGLDDHVAEVDADAQFDAAFRPDAGVPLRHRLLHLDRAAHRIDDARKFHQHAVAGGLDDPAVVLGDLRIEELAAQRFEAFVRAFLVRPHQPRIPRHIGGEDRGKAAGCRHGWSGSAFMPRLTEKQ